MKQRAFYWTAAVVFVLASAAHFVRSVMGWDLVINTWQVPVGVSVVAFLLAGFLAYSAVRLALSLPVQQEKEQENGQGQDDVQQG